MQTLQCPGCASALDDRLVLEHRVRACPGCGGLWIARPDVLALRKEDPGAHSLLSQRGEDTSAGKRAAVRPCPACSAVMLGFAFAGGNTRVEACDACDHAFLERGELAAVVAEAHHGIEMSEVARQQLHAHRVQSTWERMSGTDLSILIVGVFCLFMFVRIVNDFGPTSITIAVAGAVCLVGFLYWRRKLKKDHGEDAARLGRLMDAEEHRLARGGSDPPVKRLSKPARAKPQACPFCGAALASGSTHCNACDSDFGAAGA